MTQFADFLLPCMAMRNDARGRCLFYGLMVCDGETSDERQIGPRGFLIRSLGTAVMSVELRVDCLPSVCGESFTTAR